MELTDHLENYKDLKIDTCHHICSPFVSCFMKAKKLAVRSLKVLSIKFKLSTQHSSALRKSLPKCHSGANFGLLFTTTSEIFNYFYSKSLLL